jgi:hypothetical protein
MYKVGDLVMVCLGLYDSAPVNEIGVVCSIYRLKDYSIAGLGVQFRGNYHKYIGLHFGTKIDLPDIFTHIFWLLETSDRSSIQDIIAGKRYLRI